MTNKINLKDLLRVRHDLSENTDKLTRFLNKNKMLMLRAVPGIDAGTVINVDSVVMRKTSTYDGRIYEIPGLQSGAHIRFSDIHVLEEVDRETLSSEIVKLKEESEKIDASIKDLNEKIDYLKENDLEVLNEKDYKIYKLFNLFEEEELDKESKIKHIGKLIG